MTKNTSSKDLDLEIQQLELQQTALWNGLKSQTAYISNQLKPVSLLKQTLSELASEPDFKTDLIETSLGFAAGYFSKKMIVGDSDQPLRNWLGNFVQMSVTRIISKNAAQIKAGFLNLTSSFHPEKEENIVYQRVTNQVYADAHE